MWGLARRAGAPVRSPSVTDATPDLPAIGAPATRALAAEGIVSLAGVAERSEAELLALHGVGPRALRILREHLAAAGLAFRDGD